MYALLVNIMNEIELIDCYTAFLKNHGVQFYKNGFPIFEKSWYISTKPKVIAPYSKRQYYKECKSEISICYFEKDAHLYPRLEKVFDEIRILANYHSVCMMDISISPLMLDEVQRFNILLNLLFTCVVAVHGIKIIPSFKTGNYETVKLLKKSIGDSKYWIMGAIGTQQIYKNSYYECLFRNKCMMIAPNELLIYGKPNKSTTICLDQYGIRYISIYKDFRTLSYSSLVKYERL